MRKWVKESCLLLGLIAFIVSSYYLATTKGSLHDFSRYSLSPTTLSLLHQINHPSYLNLYTQDIDLYHQVEALVRRYQLIQPNIQFTWQKQAYVGNQSSAVLILTYHNQQQIIEIDRQLPETQLTQA